MMCAILSIQYSDDGKRLPVQGSENRQPITMETRARRQAWTLHEVPPRTKPVFITSLVAGAGTFSIPRALGHSSLLL